MRTGVTCNGTPGDASGIDVRDAEIALCYVSKLNEIAEEERAAASLDEAEGAIARRIVDPLVGISLEFGPSPNLVPAMMHAIEGIGEHVLSAAADLPAMPEDDLEWICGNPATFGERVADAVRARISLTRSSLAGSPEPLESGTAELLADVEKLMCDDRSVHARRGFLNSMCGAKSLVARRRSIEEGAARHARGESDIAIWFSRWLFAPAIENAGDGFVDDIAMALAALDDEHMLSVEFRAFLVNAGLPHDSVLDTARFHESARQVIRARTGYNFPVSFAMALSGGLSR